LGGARAWVMGLWLAGCGHGGGLRAQAFERWVGCSAESSYTTLYSWPSEGRTGRARSTQQCRLQRADGALQLELEGSELGEEGERTRFSMRALWDAEGYRLTHLQGYGCDLTYDPPTLMLPAQPRRVQSWSAPLTRIDGLALRTCQLERGSPFCERGAVVTCRTTQGSRELMERDHYCPGQGWRAQDGAVYVGGEPFLQLRTYGEQGGAEPQDEARPLPRPDEIAHPTPPPEAQPAPISCFTGPPR
jgi:hypothetical protein